MKRFLILLSFCLSCNFLQAQTIVAAGPTVSNRVLIDTLLEVTRFKSYFNNFRDSLLEAAAGEKKWDSLEIESRRLKISYDDFKKTTIYNEYSSFTEQQIQYLINYCRRIRDPNELSQMILKYGPFIQYNLDLLVKRYIGLR